jgi:hypothetical protein
MDNDQLITHARARFDHAAARRVLKEKYQAKMLFAHGGGMWRAGPDLLAVLNSCQQDILVLADLYEIPVQVNKQELYDLACQRWQEQMHAWMIEYNDTANRR